MSIERYLISLEKSNYSDVTVKQYRRALNLLVEALPTLDTASRIEITDAVDSIMDGSPATRNQRLAAIKGYYRWLYDTGRREDNPVLTLKSAKQGVRLPRTVDTQTVAFMKRSAGNSPIDRRDEAIVAVFLYTGIRVSELCDLNVGDVKRDELLITGKGSKQRFVLMNTEARKKLESWLDVRHMLKPTDEAVFISNRGARLTRQGVNLIVAEKGGAGENISPHRLRHTFATTMIENGASLEVVRQLMGHESLATTQRYLSLSNSHIKRAYKDAMGES